MDEYGSLALQLRFLFTMSFLSGGLMGAAPAGSGDDMRRADAALGEAVGEASDFL